MQPRAGGINFLTKGNFMSIFDEELSKDTIEKVEEKTLSSKLKLTSINDHYIALVGTEPYDHEHGLLVVASPHEMQFAAFSNGKPLSAYLMSDDGECDFPNDGADYFIGLFPTDWTYNNLEAIEKIKKLHGNIDVSDFNYIHELF